MLHGVAVCCSVLQCVAVIYPVLDCNPFKLVDVASLHQISNKACVAVCCSVLQCLAVPCSALQCLAVPCNEMMMIACVT